MPDVRATVLAILVDLCQTDEVQRDPDVDLFESGLLDSFGTVELFVAIEQHLGIALSMAEFDRDTWATPNAIIARLEER